MIKSDPLSMTDSTGNLDRLQSRKVACEISNIVINISNTSQYMNIFLTVVTKQIKPEDLLPV